MTDEQQPPLTPSPSPGDPGPIAGYANPCLDPAAYTPGATWGDPHCSGDEATGKETCLTRGCDYDDEKSECYCATQALCEGHGDGAYWEQRMCGAPIEQSWDLFDAARCDALVLDGQYEASVILPWWGGSCCGGQATLCSGHTPTPPSPMSYHVNAGTGNACESGAPIDNADACMAAAALLGWTYRTPSGPVDLDYAPGGCMLYDGVEAEFQGVYLNANPGSAAGSADHHKLCGTDGAISPSPSPSPMALCSVCEGALNTNDAPLDWASQMAHVNPAIMPGCAAAVIDACFQSGGDNMPYDVCENGVDPITRDLGWDKPEDFDYASLIGCVPRIAPPPGLPHAFPPSHTAHSPPKASRPHAPCSNVW